MGDNLVENKLLIKRSFSYSNFHNAVQTNSHLAHETNIKGYVMYNFFAFLQVNKWIPDSKKNWNEQIYIYIYIKWCYFTKSISQKKILKIMFLSHFLIFDKNLKHVFYYVKFDEEVNFFDMDQHLF